MDSTIYQYPIILVYVIKQKFLLLFFCIDYNFIWNFFIINSNEESFITCLQKLLCNKIKMENEKNSWTDKNILSDKKFNFICNIDFPSVYWWYVIIGKYNLQIVWWGFLNWNVFCLFLFINMTSIMLWLLLNLLNGFLFNIVYFIGKWLMRKI